MTAVLHVCTTCRGTSDPLDACAGCPIGGPGAGQCGACPLGLAQDMVPGARLFAALEAMNLPDGVEVRAVQCLSACSQGCSVALSGPGKWAHVYGRLSAADVAEIIAGAASYAQSEDGLVPWRDCPEIFRNQSLARIPPQV